MTIYTVCVRNVMEDEFMPWVASFETRDKAVAFEKQIKEIIKQHGEEGFWQISHDSGEVDSLDYLEWLRDYYDEEEEVR